MLVLFLHCCVSYSTTSVLSGLICQISQLESFLWKFALKCYNHGENWRLLQGRMSRSMETGEVPEILSSSHQHISRTLSKYQSWFMWARKVLRKAGWVRSAVPASLCSPEPGTSGKNTHNGNFPNFSAEVTATRSCTSEGLGCPSD